MCDCSFLAANESAEAEESGKLKASEKKAAKGSLSAMDPILFTC